MARRIKVKPGKTQSKFSFFVGLAFVLIGVVVVIPTFGPFGILWTAVAGYIAFSHYKNGFTSEGVPTHEIEIDDDQGYGYTNMSDYSAPQYTSENDIEVKLRKLEDLYNKDLITSEEYEKKRQEILDEF